MNHPGKCTFAVFNYTVCGFPKVELVYFIENGNLADHYVKVKGVAQRERFININNPKELVERFENYVRQSFENDATVQG